MKYLVLLAALAAVAAASRNCPSGQDPTDNVCCKDDFCDGLNEEDCGNKGGCEFLANECVLARIRSGGDRTSYVCCSSYDETCRSMAEGYCPKAYQVPRDCCVGVDALKYDGVLRLNNASLACCNAPCEQMKANCPTNKPDLPDQCKPSGRSFFGGGPGHAYEHFNKKYVPSDYSHGNTYYTGLEHKLPHEDSHVKDYEKKKKEITADDYIHLLTEALQNEHDVSSYAKEVRTDPYFGKTYYGGDQGSFSFYDPYIMLSQIYGNRYGAALGQLPQRDYGQHQYSIAPYVDDYGYGSYGGYGGGQYGSYGPQYGSYGYGGSYGGGYGSYGSGYGSSHGPQRYGNSYGGGYGSGGYGNSHGNSYGGGYGNQHRGSYGRPHGGSYGKPHAGGSYGNPYGGGHGNSYGPGSSYGSDSYGGPHGNNGGGYGRPHGGQGYQDNSHHQESGGGGYGSDSGSSSKNSNGYDSGSEKQQSQQSY